MANEKRLIDANALKENLWFLFKWFGQLPCSEEDKHTQQTIKKCIKEVDKIPTVGAVSRGAYDQVRWERDVAIGQLEQHGIPFGGIAPDVVKVVRCKDCDWYRPHEDSICVNPKCGKSWYGCPVPPEHYCSFGERREGE